MAINTLNELSSTLGQYSAKDWAKSADLDVKSPYNLGDAPKLPAENGEIQKPFGEFLADSMNKVNGLQNDANIAVQKLVTGESKNIHETLLAVEKADIAFRSMNQIRSKILDAYREVMKMQI